MRNVAGDGRDARRLALALLVALGLHVVLLLGIPVEGWSLRHSQPLRFDVVLLPPIAPPPAPEPESPTSSAPEPPEPVPQVGPPAPAVLPEPVPPPPAPSIAPRPLPPKPVVTVKPKPPLPKPPPVAQITPAPHPVVKSPLPRPSPQPVVVPKATREPSSPPPRMKPPAPPTAPAETQLPAVAKPSTPPPERLGRNNGAGTGHAGRLDSATLLGQVAGLETETQQRASGSQREQRVHLADTRSLAGFYAADWARKVARVGEMNFPEAARRLESGAGPLLEVAIRADGSLRDVRVLRSSGSAELDRAAQRIAELAAPYPPFPPELRRQMDLLRIAAPWRFDPGGRIRVR